MSDRVIYSNVFLTDDCQKIFRNKFIIILGDSVTRGIYKDLITLLQSNKLLENDQLKKKGEFACANDILLQGGMLEGLTNNIDYSEVREFKTANHLVRFYFITRCFSDYFMSICADIKLEHEKPDVVIMNSGCWDITRYGSDSIYQYKQNLPKGLYELCKCLPKHTLFMWLTTMPISRKVSGGFMVPEAEEHRRTLREDILEANKYAVAVINQFKLDLLDLHYYFHNQTDRRVKDGIHWDPIAHRGITNLILNHICGCWNINITGRKLVKDEIENFKKFIVKSNYEDAFSDDDFNEDLNEQSNKKPNNNNEIRPNNALLLYPQIHPNFDPNYNQMILNNNGQLNPNISMNQQHLQQIYPNVNRMQQQYIQQQLNIKRN